MIHSFTSGVNQNSNSQVDIMLKVDNSYFVHISTIAFCIWGIYLANYEGLGLKTIIDIIMIPILIINIFVFSALTWNKLKKRFGQPDLS